MQEKQKTAKTKLSIAIAYTACAMYSLIYTAEGENAPYSKGVLHRCIEDMTMIPQQNKPPKSTMLSSSRLLL